MGKLMFKIGGTLTAGALIASGLAGAAFADNTITGNGGGSVNTISVTDICTAGVVQANESDITVGVKQKANTGGNTASGNTGGDVTIDTGTVNQTATVGITGSSNTAVPPSCCGCQEASSSATISGNGAGSINGVTDTTVKTTGAVQANKTKVKAKVRQKAKTGKNKANNNTDGTVEVLTGNTTSGATIGVGGSTNNLP